MFVSSKNVMYTHFIATKSVAETVLQADNSDSRHTKLFLKVNLKFKQPVELFIMKLFSVSSTTCENKDQPLVLSVLKINVKYISLPSPLKR